MALSFSVALISSIPATLALFSSSDVSFTVLSSPTDALSYSLTVSLACRKKLEYRGIVLYKSYCHVTLEGYLSHIDIKLYVH
jgi:hypothetical protein